MQQSTTLLRVAAASAEVLPRDQADAWLMTPNRLLDGRPPADLVREGQHQRVLALIGAMADGIFV